MEREAVCRVVVVAAGRELKEQAESLSLEQTVSVTGFITRADNRTGQQMLILHAQQIDAKALEADKD